MKNKLILLFLLLGQCIYSAEVRKNILLDSPDQAASVLSNLGSPYIAAGLVPFNAAVYAAYKGNFISKKYLVPAMLLGNSAALYIAYLNSKGTNSGLFNQSFNSYLSDSMSSLKNYFKKAEEVVAEEVVAEVLKKHDDLLKMQSDKNQSGSILWSNFSALIGNIIKKKVKSFDLKSKFLVIDIVFTKIQKIQADELVTTIEKHIRDDNLFKKFIFLQNVLIVLNEYKKYSLKKLYETKEEQTISKDINNDLRESVSTLNQPGIAEKIAIELVKKCEEIVNGWDSCKSKKYEDCWKKFYSKSEWQSFCLAVNKLIDEKISNMEFDDKFLVLDDVLSIIEKIQASKLQPLLNTPLLNKLIILCDASIAVHKYKINYILKNYSGNKA